MKNYIDEIDEEFIENFLCENVLSRYIKIYNIAKFDDYWKVVLINGHGDKTEMFLSNFNLKYKKFSISKFETEWQIAMCKKFGYEYYENLKDELISNHIKKVQTRTNNLKETISKIKQTSCLEENIK